MKQTTVEWLEDEYLKLDANFHYSVISYEEYRIKRKELFTQAKEMELKQRKTDYRAGWNDNRSKDLNCEFYLTKHLTDSHKKQPTNEN
jgi:hypothetical protein